MTAIVLVNFIGTSCITTHPLTIEVLQPPEISVPIDIHDLLLINHSVYRPGEDTLDISSFKVNNLVAREYMNGIMDGMKQSPVYDTSRSSIVLQEILRRDEDDQRPLDSLILFKYLGDLYHKSAILTLEKIGLYGYAEQEIVPGNDYDEDIISGSIAIHVNQNLVTRAYLKIYRNQDSILLDEYLMEDTLVWYDSREVNRDMMMEAVYWAGIDYCKRIIPTWVQVDRFFYRGTTKEDRKAYQAVQKNLWMEAARHWKLETANKNASMAARACFNMALACEVNDQVALALEWAKKSYDLRKTKSTSTYITILKKRLIDRQSLEW
jgi:hypothetical protein